MNDVDALSLLGLDSGPLGILLTLAFALLCLLVPFLMWRIWQQAAASHRQLEQLNAMLGLWLERTGRAAVATERPPGKGLLEESLHGESLVGSAGGDLGISPGASTGSAQDGGGERETVTGDGSERISGEEAGLTGGAPGEEQPEAPGIPAPAGQRPDAGEEDQAGTDLPLGAAFRDFPAAAAPAEEERAEAAAKTDAGKEEFPAAVVPLPGDPQRPDTRFARCTGCGHKLAYKLALAGKRVKCPSCRTVFTLP